MTAVIFDRYQALGELSRRGQIETLKCRDRDGSLRVLKVFESPSEADRTRVENRAGALANLDHPGLAKSHGVVTDGEKIAIVYDWVEGETIASLIERGVRFTDRQLFECMRNILDALSHAHSQSPPVIHRDLKPQNIVWTGERFVLIDFDSAREVFADSGSASVVGTTGYAGPEQFVGNAEQRSDQYGLAATVLHMATHQHPTAFPLAGLRIDLTKTTLSIPLRRVLDRMLEPNVERRYDNVDVAKDAVTTEDGLEAWEVALEPLKTVQSVVHAKRDGDTLRIEISPRASSLGWLKYALGTVAVVPFYFATSLLPAVVQEQTLSLLTLPVQIMCFIVFIYLLSRMAQEYRSRVAATLVVTQDRWSIEHGQSFVDGQGAMAVRTLEHTSAESTGGITPISIRGSLAVTVDHSDHKFGEGLLPLEATAIVEAVRAFQGPDVEEVTFGELAGQEAAANEEVDAVAEVSANV